MSNKKKKLKSNRPEKKYVIGASATKRMLTIFISVFVGIAITIGAVAGVISAVNNSPYIIYSEGVGVDEGLLNYFTAYYKTYYFKKNSIPGTSDTEEFWNRSPYAPATNTTNEQFFKVELEAFIKKLIASNVIFDEMFSLSSTDRKEIKIAMQNVFARLQVDSKSEFNEAVKEFGFDYSDFKRASEMIYKDYVWSNYAFGVDGSNMQSYPEYCNEFLNEYSRVKFIFIRTENTFKLDEEGNRIVENGSDVTVALTEEEKAERQQYIDIIKECVDGINAGTNDKSGFDKYASDIRKAYGEITVYETDGYYLYSSSEFTSAFYNDIPNAAKAALELELGEGSYIELKADEDGFAGYCFMYRDEVDESAYYDTSEEGFFADFYALAKNALYNEMIDEYDNFESRASFAEVSIINIPYMSNISNYMIQLDP